MGLYKLGDERLLPDTKPVLGMIRKVHHLVAWERIEGAPAPNGRRSRARKAPAVAG
jgi:hypothetical protein